MNKLLLTLITLFLWTSGCSSSKNTTQDGKMHISKAEYKNWTEPPIQNSDVPEKGTDLYVSIENWPQDANAEYILYNKQKSFEPEVVDSSDNEISIKARIVTLSSVLVDKSKKIDLSDRLVYTTTQGDTSFIEIPAWDKK